MDIRVKDRQTVLDVAVQYLGSAEAAIILAARNGIELTQRLYDGQLLTYELADVLNERVRQTFALQGIVPATEITKKEEQELLTATAKWIKGKVYPPYIVPDTITRLGTDRDNLTNRNERTTAVEDILNATAERVRRAAARNVEIESESGTTLARIFSDQFNDVFA